MEKEQIERAKTLLTRDVNHAKLLIESASSVSSPVITGMPKGSHISGRQEDIFIDAATAKKLIHDVKSAISLLSKDEAIVLTGLYLDGLNATELANRLHVGVATIYRRCNEGLADFVYAFRGGELLIEHFTA